MTDIVVPTLGESVTEATVAQWLKKPGDAVAADDPLVELETDKVSLEVNAPSAGVLAEVLVAEGENVEVGALLGRIGDGEAAAASKPAAAEAPAVAEPEAEPAAVPAPTAATGNGQQLEIVVPALGESVTEATVGAWSKQVGDSVAADEALVELETDKVSLEVNAPSAGVLAAINVEEGATVEVGAVLGLVAAGATSQAAAPPPVEQQPTAAPTAPAPPAPSTPSSGGGLDPSQVARSGAGGKITAADLKAFLQLPSMGGVLELSGPAVRKAIADNNLDPARIAATGREGRIIMDDVVNHLSGKTAPLAAPAPAAAATTPTPTARASVPASEPREERVKMTRLRKTIAKRLKEAQNTAALLTTFNEADMGAVMALRAQYRDSFEKKHGIRLGFTSFFTKAVVAALQEIPAVNAEIQDDELVYKNYYDIGMAVSTPTGLMVPVVRDCDKKSFAEIEGSLVELAKKGRDGKLTMEEMTGGSFTITNGGVFGSLLSTPILNRPQSGILGLHKIQERPMAVNGKVEIRPMMYLALTYDHRIIDGREAVTFLVRVKENIEDPERLLLGL